MVGNLRKKNLISANCASMLETSFSGVIKELTKGLVTQKKKKNAGAYPKEIRRFAMTLRFYSAKAYSQSAMSVNGTTSLMESQGLQKKH